MEEHQNTVGTSSVFDTESIDEIINELDGRVVPQHEEPVRITEIPNPQEQLQAQNAIPEPEAEETAVEYTDSLIDGLDKSIDRTDITTARFSGAEWYEKTRKLNIIIAGIGGIGSWLSLFVSRLKPYALSLFDDDIVDPVNLAGQLYSINDAGLYKVCAMSEKIRTYSDYLMTSIFNEKYTGQFTTDVMLCGFDNMKARKTYYYKWKNHVLDTDIDDRCKCLFLDGRLGLEELQVFAIRGNESELMNKYENEFLFDDSEAEQVPCSMKQTSFMASMIGSVMTNLLVNFATNIGQPMDVRQIPFLTTYDATTMKLQLTD